MWSPYDADRLLAPSRHGSSLPRAVVAPASIDLVVVHAADLVMKTGVFITTSPTDASLPALGSLRQTPSNPIIDRPVGLV